MNVDFTEVMRLLKDETPYNLYRIKVAIENEIENPERIKTMREQFAIGDQITYFDKGSNTLISAVVLDKKMKNVRVKNLCDKKIWILPYYMINLGKKESDIHMNHKEKPTKNHFKIGDYVGFNHDGVQCFGMITKLNYKTASLVTRDNKCWRVSYGLLFKVLDGEFADSTSTVLIGSPGNVIEYSSDPD